MKYVYLLQSLSHPNEYYTGSTEDFTERLKTYNAGRVPHTAKFRTLGQTSNTRFSTLKSACLNTF